MRKYCKDCCREQRRLYKINIKMEKITQPVTPEPPTIDYSTNPLYCLCIDCNQYKFISTDFYLHKGGNPITKRCKDCQRELDRQEADQKRRDNGGSMMIPQRCNVYFDSYQRENTFQFMQLMGYLYDEETGIWHKPGWKEIVDGKPVFVVIKEKRKNKPKKIKSRIMNDEMRQKMIELWEKKLNYGQIANKLKISSTTIRKYLLEYEQDRTHQGG